MRLGLRGRRGLAQIRLNKFVGSVSKQDNGFALRLEGIGSRDTRTIRPLNTAFDQATLAVWYPTENDDDAPLDMRDIMAGIEECLPREVNPRFWVADRPVIFDHNDGLLPSSVIEARKAYMFRNHLNVPDIGREHWAAL